MSGIYEDLKSLDELRKNGSITEEEYQREKERILNSKDSENRNNSQLWGMSENSFLMLLHLSQFGGFILPFFGFILPIIMWATQKDGNANVDRHGKNILNFILSWIIYGAVAGVLTLVLIGLPILIVLGVLEIVFVIMAALKANNGEYWSYPMTIKFFS